MRKIALGCGILLLIGLAGVAVLFLVVMGAIKSSEIFKMATEMVESSPQVRAELGEVEGYGFPTGSISTSGGSGSADFSLEVEGSKSSGELYVKAEKVEGEWRPEIIAVKCDSGQRIDLLAEAQPQSTAFEGAGSGSGQGFMLPDAGGGAEASGGAASGGFMLPNGGTLGR
jgi:hypothetical protein